MGIKEKLEAKKKEMLDKRMGKVMNKVSEAQKKKEDEFKAIANHLDNRMDEFDKRIRKIEMMLPAIQDGFF